MKCSNCKKEDNESTLGSVEYFRKIAFRKAMRSLSKYFNLDDKDIAKEIGDLYRMLERIPEMSDAVFHDIHLCGDCIEEIVEDGVDAVLNYDNNPPKGRNSLDYLIILHKAIETLASRSKYKNLIVDVIIPRFEDEVQNRKVNNLYNEWWKKK